MNRLTLSHGQSAVPMNLFATWEVDRTSPHSIPRVCSIALGKLILVREFDKDAQSFFLAVRMQYSHFVKRDGNTLQIMLQRKKRYKNRAMLGYKTLAIGTLDLAQIIQCPITDESSLDLIGANKDQRNGSSVQAQVVISNAHSSPADEVEASLEQAEKRHEADRLPDMDNYTDDEETYSSDQEMYHDDDKRKTRMKHRLSTSSRQQNFIKAKLIALLRRFKQGEDEGLDEEIGQGSNENDADAEDLNFLYNQIEDLNLSDSCPEVEDNISILSTPKPKLSSQTEICSLRDHLNTDHIEPVEEIMDSPAKERSDSSEPEEYAHRASTVHEYGYYNDDDSSLNQSGTSSVFSQPHQEQYRKLTQRESDVVRITADSADYHASGQDGVAASESKSPYSLPYLHGSLSSGEDENVLNNPILLVDCSGRRGAHLGDAFKTYLQSGNSINAVIIGTTARDQLRPVFAYLTAKLQKLLSSNLMPAPGVKILVAGLDSYFNLILQQFIEYLSSRSPEWISYFLFLLVPLGKTRLGQYLSSLDGHYGKLFSDQTWLDTFERSVSVNASSMTPTTVQCNTTMSNQDRSHADIVIVRRILEYIDQAVSTLSLSIAEAMLTFGGNSENERSSQKFVPFISEAKVFLLQVDSDREEGSMATPISNVSHSPSMSLTNATNTQTHIGSGPLGQETKMGLQVDYWKDRDLSKYTLKTTFKSFTVSKLPLVGEHVANPSLSLDVVTIGKKNIMKIDGIEWSEVKFFQLSSFWSSHIKTFPVGVFPS